MVNLTKVWECPRLWVHVRGRRVALLLLQGKAWRTVPVVSAVSICAGSYEVV